MIKLLCAIFSGLPFCVMHAQPTQTRILDTTYFAFGNPPAKAACNLKLQPPAIIISGGITTFPAPLYYNFTGGAVDLYLTPSPATYGVTGTCTYGSGGNKGTVNITQNWLIATPGGPYTISQVITPGSLPASTLIPITQISPAGAAAGQCIEYNGVAIIWNTCGGAGGSVAWGAITGTLSTQTDLQNALNAKQDALGFTPENTANRGIANGYAPLNGSTLVPLGNIPVIPFSQTTGVQAALGYTPPNPANNLADAYVTQATARSNLGLAIGTNVEAWHSFLDVLAGMDITGNGVNLATSTGAVTAGNCTQWDANGNVVDAGGPCGVGTGNVNGPGAVTNGFAALWTGTANTLGVGLPVSATPGNSTIVESNGSGKLASGWFGAGSIGTAALASPTGNGANVATATGTLTAGHCVQLDATGNFVDAGSACATGSGNVTGPGPVTSGFLPQWGASNNLLTTGLAVSATPAASTVVEAGGGGTIAGGWLPAPGASTFGAVKSLTCSSNQFFSSLNTSGVFTCGTPPATGITSLTLNPTANQVLISGTANPITLTGNVTFSLPQNIHTGATPQFSSMGLGGAAGSANTLSIFGTTSGSVKVQVPATAGANVMTIPAATGNFITSADSGTVTNGMLAGSIAASKLVGTDIATVGTITAGVWHGTAIANANLANSSVTYTAGAGLTGGGAVSLGGSATTSVATGGITNAMLAGSIAIAKLSFPGGTNVWLNGAGAFTTPPGTGTVTVVSSGNLNSTSFVTGGGSQTAQTPNNASTLDSNGNASFAGSLTVGTAALTPTSISMVTGVVFASLPAASVATAVYCTNCTVSACGTLGTGAWAFFNPGSSTWSCPF